MEFLATTGASMAAAVAAASAAVDAMRATILAATETMQLAIGAADYFSDEGAPPAVLEEMVDGTGAPINVIPSVADTNGGD